MSESGLTPISGRPALPDRGIYNRRSPVAYIASLFVHAWGEWVDFIQQDHRVIAVSAAALVLGLLFAGLWAGWQVTMNEVLPALFIGLLPTLILGSAVYVWCLVKAPYALHRRAQITINELTMPAHSGDASEHDESMVLAGQLSHFLSARGSDYSSQFDDKRVTLEDDLLDSMDFSPSGQKRARQRESEKRRHNDFTLQVYGERFFGRVVAASRKLRELGVGDTETSHLRRYPLAVGDIVTVIRELEAASAALPSGRAPETAEERYWNLRTQAEGPELAMKILRGTNPGSAESKPKPEFDFTYSSANSLFDPPRSDTYRLRLFNRAEATTVDDVRVRVMSIPTDKQWAGVLPVGLRAQHGSEAPFTLNGTSPLLIDLLEYSAEQMPQVVTTWSEVGADGQRHTMSRTLQHLLLCTDSRSPQVIIDCGEGKVHDITIEVQGRNIQTCLKTFRVRSLLPNRGADSGALEITEV